MKSNTTLLGENVEVTTPPIGWSC